MISVLSPFSNSGCEYFNRSGNTPVTSTLLNIYVSGDIMKGALAFKILSDISSYPREILFFCEFIILFIIIFN